MSLKAELETWATALKSYDAQEFDKAIDQFNEIADNSKILTNIGLIYATLGEHEAAVQQFMAATDLDQYLAVAYFQCGVSNFLLQRYDLALQDFEGALLQLRGNENINYEQLGLKFKLYAAEVLFNKGLSQIYMGNVEEGMAVMMEAQSQKSTEEHNVIDDAIADRGDGYTVFSIPIGVLYRPSETKLKNAKTKDYMGKAKLVATSDASEAYTTFSGVTRLKQGISPSNTVLDDAPAVVAASLTRAATVAVTDRPTVPDADRPQVNLQRAKTTISVPADARERIRARAAGGSPVSPTGAGLARSATSSSGNSATRGLSVRRPGGPAPPALGMGAMAAGAPMSTRSSPTSSGRKPEARLTEFYDSYIDSYGAEEPLPPLPGQGQGSPNRVANWARNNASPGVQRSRSMAPPSSYAASNAGGPLRRKTTRRAPSRSTYYEEEEGYASGDYDDGPLDLVKIRVKIHCGDEVRGMAIDPTLTFDDFADRVTTKFGKSLTALNMKFKDEDGGKVSLRDESDYEMAIETVRESAKGKAEGKLEIWCADA